MYTSTTTADMNRFMDTKSIYVYNINVLIIIKKYNVYYISWEGFIFEASRV